ncbi:MAG: kelch repeat-containing protein [Chthoniobacterales bacterium]
MNLPSLSWSGLATGVCSLMFVVSAHGAAPPPVLNINTTKIAVGSAVSGAAARLNDYLYFAGGTSAGTVTNAVTAVNLYNDTVTSLATMPTARAGLGLVGIFYNQSGTIDALLAVGGTNGSTAVGNVELYNLTTGTWTELAPMPTPRAYLSVVWGVDHKVYAIGGVNSSGQTVGTVEIYDPANNTWAEGPSLNTARSHHAAVLSWFDLIFVAGGVDASGNVLSSTEVYNLSSTTPVWITGFPMNTPRSDFGIALSADGYLHAFGGLTTGGTQLKTIEGYQFSTGKWTIEPHSLPVPLSGIAVTEALEGADFIVGGQSGSTIETTAIRAKSPKTPSNTVTFFVHTDDQPYVDGNQAMDQIPPLNTVGLLSLGLLSTTSFTSNPGISGTIAAGGSLTVDIPGTIIVGAVNTVTVTAENEDGTDPVTIGSVNSLLGLSGVVTVPITPPVALRKKVLVLSLSTLLGVDLNLSGGVVTVNITGLDGNPSNPQ